MRYTIPFLFLFSPICGFTQDKEPESAKNPGVQIVELDLAKGLVKNNALVPYDVRLLFTADIPEKVDSTFPVGSQLSLYYLPNVCPAINDNTVPGDFESVSSWTRKPPTSFGPHNIIEFPWFVDTKHMLRPNRAYCLLVRRNPDRGGHDSGQQSVGLRTASKFADYVKLDFGLGYAFTPKVIMATIAIHGYLIPFNNDTDLAEPFNLGRQLLLRTSVFAGIAPVTFLPDTRQELKSYTDVGNLIFGVGFRGPFYYPNCKTPDKRIRGKFLLQSMRLNVGWMVFKQPAANSVIALSRSKITPYVSLTYDFNLVSLLGPIAKLFGAG